MDLSTYLEGIDKSNFSASLSPRGGYITFSNSGRRGDTKYFQIGIDSFLTTLKDILEHIDSFSKHNNYVEDNWRNLGPQFFTDQVALTTSTVQTKPLFSTLSKLIVWANQPLLDGLDTDQEMPLTKEYVSNAIVKLELLAESYTPKHNMIAGVKLDDNIDYTIEELGMILKLMYESADNGKQVISIYMFGIKYGAIIKRNQYSAKQIITISGLSDSYATELSKSLNLFDSINNRSFGLSFINNKKTVEPKSSICMQTIFYGAPGTGKSHKVKQITENKNKTVVTFHPDTDYASFVGAYKPTMHEDGKTITYGFVPQAFAKAYVNAWKDSDTDYYLVIEEINRGNCAQIFGDIFQLLDRNAEGYSDYVIDVDQDFAGYIESELSEKDNYKDIITNLAISAGEDESLSYSKIALPSNLHILATMNTSDQSLFPMDSAFKRRWDWEYLRIEPNKVDQVSISINGNKYSWSDFIKKVNEKIYNETQTEDKQIGPFFVKVKNEDKTVITFNQMRSKVMFYLWFEIFKDVASNESIFAYSENGDTRNFLFADLFEDNGEVIMDKFMNELKVNKISDNEPTTINDTQAN